MSYIEPKDGEQAKDIKVRYVAKINDLQKRTITIIDMGNSFANGGQERGAPIAQACGTMALANMELIKNLKEEMKEWSDD